MSQEVGTRDTDLSVLNMSCFAVSIKYKQCNYHVSHIIHKSEVTQGPWWGESITGFMDVDIHIVLGKYRKLIGWKESNQK